MPWRKQRGTEAGSLLNLAEGKKSDPVGGVEQSNGPSGDSLKGAEEGPKRND